MKPKHRRLLFLTLVMSFITGAGGFFFFQIQSHLVFFYTPSQLFQLSAMPNSVIRVGGLVKIGSVRFDDTLNSFILTDQTADITVEYNGILPVLFREGQGIVATGVVDERQIFNAQELLAKHDENYMPKNVQDKIKESGYWQDEYPK